MYVHSGICILLICGWIQDDNKLVLVSVTIMQQLLQVPQSKCSAECGQGQVRRVKGFHSCCFDCIDCLEGTYRANKGNVLPFKYLILVWRNRTSLFGLALFASLRARAFSFSSAWLQTWKKRLACANVNKLPKKLIYIFTHTDFITLEWIRLKVVPCLPCSLLSLPGHLLSVISLMMTKSKHTSETIRVIFYFLMEF